MVGRSDCLEAVAALTAVIAYRGPDDDGLWSEHGVALGHRRLSIVDLSENGRNPMFNEDGQIAIVFNGEIFNYRALRAELASHGHTFRSESDTEVILHLYEEVGTAVCDRLEGMYAFAIWDRTREQLFVARDPFGEKPLYYSWDSGRGTLAFCSSASALLACGVVARGLNADALSPFLLFGGNIGSHTLADGVIALPPAGCLLLDRRSHDLRTWTRPRNDCGAVGDATPIDGRLEWPDIVGAVRSRMMADVPVGVLLSAGLDSTAVAVALRQAHAGEVRSFSIGYEKHNAAFDESSAAAELATAIGTEHTSELITAEDFAAHLDDIATASDLPSHDGINTYFATRLASRTVKVAMTGIAGDELFGGYSTFRYEELVSRTRINRAKPLLALAGRSARRISRRSEDRGFTRWPLLLLEQASQSPADITYRWFQVRRLMSTSMLARLRSGAPPTRSASHPDVWNRESRQCLLSSIGLNADGHPVLQELESAGYLSPILLRDSDAMSMHHGVELRVPFLDTRLVSYAFRQPLEALVSREVGKLPLRAAVAGHVPAAALQRKKQGFGVPLGDWLRHPVVQRRVTDRLGEIPRSAEGALNAEAVRGVVRNFYSRSPAETGYRATARLWAVYSLFTWLDRFVS